MNRYVYVSTTAFEIRELSLILDTCIHHYIPHIELGMCHIFDADQAQQVLNNYHKNYGMHFLLHNYFPPSKAPFVLNLASNDPTVLEMSRQHCCKALDLCAAFNIPFYSVHSGFCFHAQPDELGFPVNLKTSFPKDLAFEIFCKSIQYLADYAANHNIFLAIENNVLSPFNLIENENRLLLGVTSDDLLEILKIVQRDNVKLLVDVGHLKVSANTLGFSAISFLKTVLPYTIVVHLSDNNGKIDEHKPFSSESWFWKCLSSKANLYYSIEISRCSINLIKDQTAIVESFLNGTI